MQSWWHILEHTADRHGDVVAARDDSGRSLTYRELRRSAERVAGGWAQRGVSPGDRVAILMRNSVGFMEQVLGLHRAGAIPVLVNWRLAGPEVSQLLDVFEPSAAACDEEFVDTLGSAHGIDVAGPDELAELGAEPPERPVERLLDTSVFAITHTSGTTGLPKGVPLTNGSLIVGALSTGGDTVTGPPGRVHLRVMPMFHLAGLAGFLQGMINGDTVIVHRGFDPAAWLDTIEAERVAFSNAGPSLLRRICDEQERRPRDLSSLIEIWYGTEAMPPDVLERALRLIGCGFRQNYGMTEAQRPVSQLGPEDHRLDSPHLGTAGRPMPGFEIRIVDNAGDDVVPGEPGEVWVRSAAMIPGYWRNPDANERAFVGPVDPPGVAWYRTGDVGSLDGGYLTIHDRVNDMVITGGENVYPAEVEAVVREHPAVHDAVIVGLPDERWGETVHAVVMASGDPGVEPDSAEIIEYCRARLAHFKCPTGVTVVDEIPRNATGKALRRVVRDQLRAT